MTTQKDRARAIRLHAICLATVLPTFLATAATAQTPLGSEFTYQGNLLDGGSPLNGTADFRFTLWNDALSTDPNDAIGVAVLVQAVPVADGLFTVDIDFGPAAFDGDERWLEIEVRSPSGPGTFTTLTPRQLLTAAPYARTAVEALNVTGIDGHSLDAADGAPADALFVDNAGKVGVGTSTPADVLHVSANGGGPAIRVENTQVGGGSAGVILADEAQEYELRMTNSDDFTIRDNTANATRFQMDTAGHVGIGTSPDATNLLEVAGTIGATAYAGDGSALTGIHVHALDAADGNPTDALFVDNDGFVGIGTTTPAERLHILAGSPELRIESTTSNSTGIFFANTDREYSIRMTSGEKFVLRDITAGNVDRLAIIPTGEVGIGTSNPVNQLSVGGDVDVSGKLGIGTTTPGTALSFRNVDEPKIAYWEDSNPANRFYGVDMASGGLVRHWVGTGGVFEIGHYNNADGAFIQRMGVDAVANGGRMEIFDNTGVSRVNAQATNNGGQVKARNTAGQDRAQMYVNSSDAGNINTFGPSGNTNVNITNLSGFPDNGFVGVLDGTSTRQAAMFVNSNGEGEIECDVMQIFGGSDIAEPFNVSNHDDQSASDDVQPGMVVSIDASRPGELRLSSRAYDNAVAGVISGAGGVKPGMTLQQPGTIADGKHPVAMTGRVWCWVDADAGGPVQPGDLLTTSDTPGHAMKAVDRDRAFGTSIGKAMTALDSGRGLVLVLVNLQ